MTTIASGMATVGLPSVLLTVGIIYHTEKKVRYYCLWLLLFFAGNLITAPFFSYILTYNTQRARKYKFANLENCWNILIGMNVNIVYFVVLTWLLAKFLFILWSFTMKFLAWEPVITSW